MNQPTDIQFFGVRGSILVVFLIAVVAVGVYAPVINYEFVTYDDDLYVTANDHVQKGLTLDGIRWAFSFNDGMYWHPLTWLSHMTDIEWYGLNSGMHHATNLLFHIANAMLLFLVLFRMTGAFWASAAVAGLFALHPLNVESVAWVASRKNLLSTFFWMLTLLTYLNYCLRPNLARYGLCLLVFFLGVLAKPMLVTLPFVLMLLDYWPLQRIVNPRRLNLNCRQLQQGVGDLPENADGCRKSIFGQVAISELLFEKIPFLLLSVVTVYLYGASIANLDIGVRMEWVPLSLRVSNALVSYWVYIRQMFLPKDLTFFYPFPEHISPGAAIAAGVALMVVTAVAVRHMRSHPYGFVGWAWFLGTLFPVIGLFQAGRWPATADRFAYVPMTGLFVAVIWFLSTLLYRLKTNRITVITAALVVLTLMAFTTRRQVEFWQNNFTLYEHAIAVTENNPLAHNNLGNAYLRRGQMNEAIEQYRECLRINPWDSLARQNLAAVMKLREQDDFKVISPR